MNLKVNKFFSKDRATCAIICFFSLKMILQVNELKILQSKVNSIQLVYTIFIIILIH